MTPQTDDPNDEVSLSDQIDAEVENDTQAEVERANVSVSVRVCVPKHPDIDQEHLEDEDTQFTIRDVKEEIAKRKARKLIKEQYGVSTKKIRNQITAERKRKHTSKRTHTPSEEWRVMVMAQD